MYMQWKRQAMCPPSYYQSSNGHTITQAIEHVRYGYTLLLKYGYTLILRYGYTEPKSFQQVKQGA